MLAWKAPEGCPDRALAVKSIQSLLRDRGVPARIDARVEITRSAVDNTRFEARITTTSAGDTGERHFEGTSCESVAQAAELMVAMAVDPLDVAEKVTEKAAPPPRTSFSLGVIVAGDLGSLPAPTLGGGAAFGLLHDRLQAEITGVAWLPRVELGGPRPGSGGEIGLYSGTARGCFAALDIGSSAVQIAGCAAAELGMSTGSGIGISHPSSSKGLFSAVLAGVAVRPAAGALRPSLLLEVGVPIVRPAFDIDGFGTVFRASPVIARASLSVAWIFP